MNTKKYGLENYKKFLLNRVTATTDLIEYIESCLASEDDAVKHTFHKVMVHNWSESENKLYEELSQYFSASFIPVNPSCVQGIWMFHTSNLNFVLRVIKSDCIFPFQRSMYNVDIIFNDKTSADCFENRITIDDIVAGVVSNRMSESFELNLSDFCNDTEFVQKKIKFYKVNLLSNFKILMLRLGRDTISLNLMNNNLSVMPCDILNFFLRGNLNEVNLSNNNFQSLSQLTRLGSKVEKLWLEGNPLCDEVDDMDYVKQIMVKYPRITVLDGINLNEYPLVMPFYKNFIENFDKKTKMVVEKFLTLYFTHYDSNQRQKIEQFYDPLARLTIATTFNEADEKSMIHYALHSRNILHPVKRQLVLNNQRLYHGRPIVIEVLTQLPPSLHDPSTFTVDVVKVENKSLMIIVDGVFIEKNHFNPTMPERLLSFRRTFIFYTRVMNNGNTMYFIRYEMFFIGHVTNEQKENSFKNPIRNLQTLTPTNPTKEETNVICDTFMHLTQLKKQLAELRLRLHNWDIKAALAEFIQDMTSNKVSLENFDDDDFSDHSSLMDDID